MAARKRAKSGVNSHQGAQELLDEARKTFVSLGLGDCLTSRQLAPSLPSIAELTAGGL